jgi:hypothetical protein
LTGLSYPPQKNVHCLNVLSRKKFFGPCDQIPFLENCRTHS